MRTLTLVLLFALFLSDIFTSHASAQSAEQQPLVDPFAAPQTRTRETPDAFGRVYALTHRAEVLLNLATAQAQTGAMLNAIESYRRFLQTASAALQRQHGDEARAALADVEASIPRLRIEASITSSETHVILDGLRLSPAELGVPLPIDPGAHHVVLERGTEVRLVLDDGKQAASALASRSASSPSRVSSWRFSSPRSPAKTLAIRAHSGA